MEDGPDGPASGGRGAALGVVRSMGGAKPLLGVLGRECAGASGRTSMALTARRSGDDGGGGTGRAEQSR